MEQEEQIKRELDQDALQDVNVGSDNDLGSAAIVATSIALVGGLGVRQMSKIARDTNRLALCAETMKTDMTGIRRAVEKNPWLKK